MKLELNIDGHTVEIDEGPYLINGTATEETIIFAKRLVARIPKYKDAACKKLLSLYNDTWLDDEIGLLDEIGFKERLVDPSINISDEIGAATVYFKDSDMFGGHFVEIGLNDSEVDHIGIIG